MRLQSADRPLFCRRLAAYRACRHDLSACYSAVALTSTSERRSPILTSWRRRRGSSARRSSSRRSFRCGTLVRAADLKRLLNLLWLHRRSFSASATRSTRRPTVAAHPASRWRPSYVTPLYCFSSFAAILTLLCCSAVQLKLRETRTARSDCPTLLHFVARTIVKTSPGLALFIEDMPSVSAAARSELLLRPVIRLPTRIY